MIHTGKRYDTLKTAYPSRRRPLDNFATVSAYNTTSNCLLVHKRPQDLGREIKNHEDETSMTLPEHHPYEREVDLAVSTVREVAVTVNRIYSEESARTYTKGDGSPVTDADLEADRLIRTAVRQAFPDDGLLTEETEDSSERLSHDRCWIADPIDGTAQFVERTGQFDVLLALVEQNIPVVSVSAHPPSGAMMLAVKGAGAWRIDQGDIASPFTIAAPDQPPRLVTSKYYGANDFAEEITSVANRLGAQTPPVMPVGFQPRAFLPEWRQYDGFVGFWRPDGDSPVREWDLATSDLFVTEAGGGFSDLYGNRYLYNQPAPRPRGGLLVSASPALHAKLLEALAPLLPASPP